MESRTRPNLINPLEIPRNTCPSANCGLRKIHWPLEMVHFEDARATFVSGGL